MRALRVLATVLVMAMAGFGIWIAGSGMRTGGDTEKAESTQDNYDYMATDVLVTQMAPDGSLQYELSAKQVSQLPRNGSIFAQDLEIHYDPPGAPPGGPNRWTLWADRAELPESADILSLQGNVHGEGRPRNSQSKITFATSQLSYDLKSREVVTRKPFDFTAGGMRSRCDAGLLRVNIKAGTVSVELPVESKCNGTFSP